MKREKELLINTIILGLGKFLPKIVSLITLPIVTAYLTKAEYGTYDLVLTLVMLIMPIATLQIQSAAFRFLIDCRNDKKQSALIITNISIFTGVSSVIVSFLLIAILTKINIIVRIAIALYFLADIAYNTIAQIARGLSRNKDFSISAIVLSVINCISVVICVKTFQQGLFGVIISLAIANAIAVIYIAIRIGYHEYINFNIVEINIIKEMLQYSWPMVPNNLSNWVLKLSDRLVITAFIGVEANATYAVANKIPGLLSIAQSVFVMAWQENASIAVTDEDAERYYSEMFDKIFSIMFGFTGLLIAGTPVMFRILIRGDYSEAYIQMPILILGMFFFCMSAFQGGIYIAHKKTKSVGITTIVAAIINLAVDFLLINFVGITAGSISSLVAYLALYIYRLVDVQNIQKIKYDIKKQLLYIVILIVLLVLCSLQLVMINIINITLALILAYFSNKELLVGIYKKILKK